MISAQILVEIYFVVRSGKLTKYLERPFNFNGRLRCKPILIADSKGNYLKSRADLINQFQYSLELQCRGGARFQDYFYWLQHNLSNKVAQYGKIVLYVWLGTCDFTVKSDLQDPTVSRRNCTKKIYIQLRHETDSEAVSYLKYQIDRSSIRGRV